MLCSAQIERFHTVGFLVLPGFLGDVSQDLRRETDAALREAYGATFDERVIDGISGHYLPVASCLTPVSTSLVCDNPRFIDAAEALLGGPVLPECPEAILYFFEAGWHNDDGIGVVGVNFVTSFDHLSAINGALRPLPGSHRPEEQARLSAHISLQTAGRGRQRAFDRRYDAVWVSPEFRVTAVAYPYAESVAAGSDHSAVVVDLEWANPALG